MTPSPGPAGDLDRQATLTGRLAGTVPVYEPVPPRDRVGAVAWAPGVPVVVTSHGPTADDKRPLSTSTFRH